MPKRKMLHIAGWVARVVAAFIFGQSLFFKFTGAEESVYIFEQVGIEPWGRYATGVAELIAAAMLLIPPLGWTGGLLGAAIVSGAIVSHLTVLGIEVKDDNGLLFAMAWIVLVCCLFVVYTQRRKLPLIGGRGKRG